MSTLYLNATLMSVRKAEADFGSLTAGIYILTHQSGGTPRQRLIKSPMLGLTPEQLRTFFERVLIESYVAILRIELKRGIFAADSEARIDLRIQLKTNLKNRQLSRSRVMKFIDEHWLAWSGRLRRDPFKTFVILTSYSPTASLAD